MAKRPKTRYKQGTVTKGQLDFEVTLKFKIRPAGWAGNDGGMFGQAWMMLSKYAMPLVGFPLLGDESVEITKVRWRRPGETWQLWRGRDER